MIKEIDFNDENINFNIDDVLKLKEEAEELLEKLYKENPTQIIILKNYINYLLFNLNEIDKSSCYWENRTDDAEEKIDKAIKELKDTSVDMPSTLIMEVIDYAIHILQGSDKE